MDILAELESFRRAGIPCALTTVTSTTGSIPRHVGAKMLVTGEGSRGSVGGGKFEALVIEAAREALVEGVPRQHTWPLHEHGENSFGAVCGGEVMVFIEPFLPAARLYLVGGGHCAQAVAKLAAELGYAITVFEDREAFREAFAPSVAWVAAPLALPECLAPADAVAVMSRQIDIDTEALATVIGRDDAGYIGMIGSRRKVKKVFEDLRARGATEEQLSRVHAPIGLDIGADTPAEIAVSVMAQILQVRNG